MLAPERGVPVPFSSPTAEIVLVLLAYLLGGIPFGWLVARFAKGVDLRTVGSGGTGATNCSRLWQGGASVAVFLVVFALDFGKGLLGGLFSMAFAERVGVTFGSTAPPLTLQVICGFAVVLGHVFTPFLRFRGGKGVATTFGVVTALAPLSSLWGLAAWAIAVLATRYMSLGSLAAVAVIPITYWLDNGSQVFDSRLGVLIFLLALAVVVFWRHRDNIRRIMEGSERKIGATQQL